MEKTNLTQGWGVNDATYPVYKTKKIDGKHKTVWRCPYYMDWVNVLRRCFNKKVHERQPTYKDCTICEDWKYFSNFIKWVDSQPNRDWMNCELDKDFLVEGNKHYSPETAVYITKNLNSFIGNRSKKRGIYMIGVNYIPYNKRDRYKAQCNNPFTLKGEYIGSFRTELKAHLAWKAKKHEHACKLADLQSDERVAKRLREMYSPDKDWTNR